MEIRSFKSILPDQRKIFLTKMKKLICIISIILVATTSISAQQKESPKLIGPYLGQKPPGLTPEIFAPGIVSTGFGESGPAISPCGDEMFYLIVEIPFTTLVSVKIKNGIWTEPVVAPFSGNYSETNLTYEDIKHVNLSSGNGRPDIYWVDAKVIEELRPKE
jgi:hypothetical protein